LHHSKHPNTYTLSKALGEDVVHHYKDTIPTMIIRPSQVWSAVQEPFVGFVEGLNSGIGLIVGAMTGLVRTMYTAKGVNIKFSPVDFVVNATIASAWKKSTVPRDEFLVFNCTDSENHSVTWEDALEISRPFFIKHAPYEKLVWYPNLNLTSNYYWQLISLFLFQFLPAIFFDIILVLSGNKRM
jgi:alcohol-forming fatty acyl-CoA reductase